MTLESVKRIFTNGFETIDGCLYRHNLSLLVEDVLQFKRNRHLATQPEILPPRTIIYLPKERPKVQEVIQLWS